MKGLFVVLCLALICITSVASTKRYVADLGEVNTNRTLEQLLNSDYPAFARLLQTRTPAIWTEIVNAPVNSPTGGDFTIFVPINVSLTPANHSEVLEYHISRNDSVISQFKIPYTTRPTLFNATGLNNHSQVLSFSVNSVDNTTIMINGERKIIGQDIIATNGVIHTIDGVLSLPASTLASIINSDFSILSTLLKRVNQSLSINDATVLAPSDDAFNALFKANSLLGYFLTGISSQSSRALTNTILNAHVIVGSFYPSTLSNGVNRFTNLNNGPVTVNKSPSGVTVLTPTGAVEATVNRPNLIASNGVVHGINSVLSYGVGLNIRETIEALNATTFLAAIKNASLENILVAEKTHVFFVPTNKAFDGKSVNTSQLLYHIVNSQDVSFTSSYLDSLLILPSLNNKPQQLFFSQTNTSKNDVTQYVNNVPVAGSYVTVGQTHIYLIDSLIPLPGSFASVLSAGNFSDLLHLLSEKHINTTGLYNINSPYTTVLAPTTEAFNKLPAGIAGYLTLPNNDSAITAQHVLNNHILPNEAIYQFNGDRNVTYRTAAGLNISVTSTASGKTIINDAINVATPGVLTENGIAYAIDGVIVPSGSVFSTVDVLNGLPVENSAYGNYSIFIGHLKRAGLYEYITSNNAYTIFPPTNAAFQAASESFSDSENATNSEVQRLIAVLNNHIVYGSNVVPVTNSTIVTPGHHDNATLQLITHGNQTVEVIYRPAHTNNTDNRMTANVVVNTQSVPRGQRVYGIDRVLGVGVNSSKSHGLTTLEWLLIGIGGAVLGLIILLVVAGAAYYLLVRPNRDGYRQIN